MAIVGISCFYHDAAAACISTSGDIIGAAQEERFSRKRHDKSFPSHALAYCVLQAAKREERIEQIVFYENPLLKFERILDTNLQTAPNNLPEFKHSIKKWLGGHIYQKRDLKREILAILPDFDIDRNLHFAAHHSAHAASAFYPSPAEEAIILTLDGVGEYATASIATGTNKTINFRKELRYPNSLGLFYSAFTHHTGFKVNSGEYKMMGLAPYGQPTYKQRILDNFIQINTDGSFTLDQRYFDHFAKDTIINEQFDAALGLQRRREGDLLTTEYADVAASVQSVVEEVIVKIIKNEMQETGLNSLCMAGGVALNSVANGRILKECGLKNFWVQPAAGDAGGALGAAYLMHHQILNRPRKMSPLPDHMQGAYLGPEYSEKEILDAISDAGLEYEHVGFDSICDTTAELLVKQNTVAWFQGRMEYGPRALGARSILADPRSKEMQRVLNLKVKKRESFRPFAPSVLLEHASEWFDLEVASPYMLLVCDVQESKLSTTGEKTDKTHLGPIMPRTDHSEIPAVTHVNSSARIQTVHANTAPLYHELITKFYQKTGCPLLVNTSFNVRGEPIVESPSDAIKCFMNTELDYLALGPFLIRRDIQDPLIALRLHQTFSPD